MGRVTLGTVLGGLLCVGVALVSGGGCAENRSSLFIVQVQAPESSTCVTKNTVDGLVYLRGVLDSAFARDYKADLLVANQLVARGDKEKTQAETSRINLEWADVSIEDEKSGAVLTGYREAIAGYVDAAKSTEPGYGLTTVTMVSAGLAAKLYPDTSARLPNTTRLVSVVKVVGRTLGGLEVESGEYRFPVTVCVGCLFAGGDCTALPKDEDQPCTIGNDMGVTCPWCVGVLGADSKVCQ